MKTKLMYSFGSLFVLLCLITIGTVVAQQPNLASHTVYGVTLENESTVSSSFRNAVPRDWINSSASHAAYTISFSSSTYEIQRCRYGAAGEYTIIRQRQRYTVKIIDNARNSAIGTRNFDGDSPSRCPQSELFGPIEYYKYYTGTNPDASRFTTWLNAFTRRLEAPEPTATPEGGPPVPLANDAIFGTWLVFDATMSRFERLYSGVFPPEWEARSQSKAAYIMEFTSTTINGVRCRFEGRDSVVSQRIRVDIEIRQVSNDRIIGRTSLLGANAICPSSWSSNITGPPPHAAQFASWLTQFRRTLPPPTVTPTATPLPSPTTSPTPLDLPDDAPVVLVNANGLNLRAGPGTSYSIVTVVGYNTELIAIGRNEAGSWIQGVTPDQQIGWASTGFLDLQGLDVTTLPVTEP